MAVWRPEIEVTEGLAATLIGRQFPELAPLTVHFLASGWDNTVFTVNDTLAFRFPHRARGVANLERELTVLELLPDELSLPVPRPVYRGRPDAAYPWPFFGAVQLPGREVAEVSLADAARVRLGAALGGFLRGLHAPVLVNRVAEAVPVDPMGRADMAIRIPMVRDLFDRLAGWAVWSAPASADAILAEAEGLPRPVPEALVHGDLHHRHLLVDDDGVATGVIDWGNACLADPSVDLSAYWSLCTPDARQAFVDEYGPISEARLLRARVLALMLCASLGASAHDQRMAQLERVSVAGLELTLRD